MSQGLPGPNKQTKVITYPAPDPIIPSVSYIKIFEFCFNPDSAIEENASKLLHWK